MLNSPHGDGSDLPVGQVELCDALPGLLQTLIDHSRDAIYVRDCGGGLRLANTVLLEALGLESEDVLGRGWQEFLRHESATQISHHEQMVCRTGEPAVFEEEIVGPERTLLYRSSKFPIRGAKGEIVAVGSVATDITQERDLESQLRQAQGLKTIGHLASGVAHDFNNVLTIITAACSFLEEDLPPDSPSQGDVQEIAAAAQSAADLTGQLLAFSRRQVVQPRAIHPNGLVADLVKMLGRLLGEHIDIQLHLADDAGTMWVDPGHFNQIVMNLAFNARDAMPDGGTLRIETAAVASGAGNADLERARRHGAHGLLTVTDTGCGMDAETQAAAFEPQFSTKNREQGAGMGLAIVCDIVQQSDGVIAMDSAPGRGSTFKIYLPAAGPDAEQAGAVDAVAERMGAGETVVLVEDNAQLRKLAARALRERGYQVYTAADLAGVADMKNTLPQIDLLVTDVVLPGGNGPEVAAMVREVHPACPVLYMSGYTDDAIAHHGVLDPELHFLLKPFTPSELGRKVGEVLAKAAADPT